MLWLLEAVFKKRFFGAKIVKNGPSAVLGSPDFNVQGRESGKKQLKE